MMKTIFTRAFLIVFLSAAMAQGAQGNDRPVVLFDFDKAFDIRTVKATDAKVSVVRTKSGRALRIQTGHKNPWPGIVLPAPKGKWDLSARAYLALDVENTGRGRLEVWCRVDNPGANGRANCITEGVALEPGARATLTVNLASAVRVHPPAKIIGMRGVPGGPGHAAKGKIDPSNVVQLLVFVPKPKVDHSFTIANVRTAGRTRTVPAKEFFPFIDEFGQYIHKDWPGKTHSLKDLQSRKKQEADDLAKHRGPTEWNKWGGWTAGPKLKATGFFHPEKHKDKWWLVDPDGRLFWSHGIDCVNTWSGTTPITDRMDYFRGLPDAKSPLSPFYGKGRWAPHGYYKGKEYRTYNFRGANLLRKYGRKWEDEFAATSHARLRSWGMNTIGNWSSPDIYLLRQTPYTVAVHFRSATIAGSKGYWRQFPDPFDASFRRALREKLAKEKDKSAGDPWCMGYFVDNELSWGDDLSLSRAALASPADQAAKKAFIADLRDKYGAIGKLNAAWGTKHASWDALSASVNEPDPRRAADDLRAFTTKIAEEYFRICREEVKRVAPNNMYLGCRFAWANDLAVKAAGRFCDVIGYNLYRYSVAEFRLPAGLDKPVVVGEFHFGALDRGMFHTGLKKTADQKDRAAKYAAYVRGALKNPQIVGTHWFQYGDQATTGRGDGENYQIGFIDICDTPYPETVAAARKIARELYKVRSKGK